MQQVVLGYELLTGFYDGIKMPEPGVLPNKEQNV